MMVLTRLLTILLLTTIPAFLFGQCPDRKAVLQFISAPSADDPSRLPILLKYISASSSCNWRQDTLYGMMLQKAARVYSEQNNLAEAINYWQKAITAFQSTNPRAPAVLKYLSQCYYSINFLYATVGLRSRYMEAVDSCIAIEKRLDRDYKYTLFFIEDKLKWYYTSGDFKRCISYADVSEALIKKHAQPKDRVRFLVYLWLNKVQSLVRLGAYDEAEKILNQLVKPNVHSLGHAHAGGLFGAYALIHKHRGEYNKEMVNDWKAFNEYKNSGYKKGCAETLISISRTLFERFGKMDSARFYLKRALSFADRVDSVYVFNVLGNLEAKAGYFDKAFQFFNQAFDKIEPGMTVAKLDSITIYQTVTTHLNVYIINLVTDQAQANLDAYKSSGETSYLRQAIMISKQANRFLSRVKHNILEMESNLSWRGKTTRLYENAIEACYLSQRFDDGFYFFEESRAVLLDDKLERFRGMSEADIVYHADLENQKQQLQRTLSTSAAGSVQAAGIYQKIFDIGLKQETLLRKVDNYKPRSAVGSRFKDLADFRARGLRNHKALVEYFAGDSAVYALTVLRDTVSISKIDKMQYDQLTLSYLYNIAKPLVYETDFSALISAGKQLYKLLFADAPVPPGRILISPDGQYFPFEALVKSSSPGAVNYLLEDNSISYVYSARYLAMPDEGNHGNASLFMGMAPVDYGADTHLAKLSGSEQSLERIAGNFNSPDYFVTDKATRKNFLDNFGKYQLTHLYTHAAANLSSGEPVLYFADSVIELNNIVIRERPSTLLIVLAACESGLGKAFAGEGVFSFNRAFASIGVPAALVNLWPVENKTTYRLNELFYGYVSKGLPFDVALQQAKLEYKRTASGSDNVPYHWAAGILTGRPVAVYGRRDLSMAIWVAVAMFVFLAAAAVWGLRRSSAG